MAVSAFTVYGNAVLNTLTKNINFSSDTFVMALLTNSYVPASATDSTWANASAFEVLTGSGYTQGGVVLTSVSCTLSGNVVTWTCAAPSWINFSASFRYPVVVRRASGSLQSTDFLVSFCDSTGGGSTTGGGGTLTITPNASGIFTATHSP